MAETTDKSKEEKLLQKDKVLRDIFGKNLLYGGDYKITKEEPKSHWIDSTPEDAPTNTIDPKATTDKMEDKR